MDFKQLRSFVTVVQYGSFTRAAEKLYLSQPTISSHIQVLEEELGHRLILRTTKSLEVTPKGQLVYDYAVRILELEERMSKECREEDNRIVQLGASTIPSAYILPQVLPAFGKLHPETYFVIHQSDSQGIINGLLDGLFDIGLIGMQEESLTCIPLCTDRMVLITPVTPEYLALKALPETPLEELLRRPIILREKGSGSQKSADRFLDKRGIPEESLNVTARINDQETIKNLVAGGLGVSIISERAARNFVEEKRILAFDLPASGERKLFLAYRKGYILQPRIQEFVTFLRKQLADHPESSAIGASGNNAEGGMR